MTQNKLEQLLDGFLLGSSFDKVILMEWIYLFIFVYR